MTDWMMLLTASLLAGAALVASMVLPRPVWAVALLAGVVSGVTAISAASAIMVRYSTVEAAFASVFFLLAGSVGGYRLAASALPHLFRARTVRPLPATTGTRDALVLVCLTDAERYSARVVAHRHERLTVGAGIEVPPTAVPFVFLAQKTRYRAVRGSAHGLGIARSLAASVEHSLRESGRDVPVSLAVAEEPTELTSRVREAVLAGARRVAVIVLGNEDSDEVEQAKSALDAARAAGATDAQVVFGGSLWHDCALAERLVERILASAAGVQPADVGVVLVCAGMPPEWEESHQTGRAAENFFNQRVRLSLAEAGMDGAAVRIAWLDWQLPDVTEAVRHVAALGRSRIVVAPSTMVLPTLESTIDMERAIEATRLPASVHVVELPPWGDDPEMVAAVVRGAAAALGLPGPEAR